MEYQLGGSRVHVPSIASDPETVRVYDYKTPTINWPALPPGTVVTLRVWVANANEVGSFVVKLWDLEAAAFVTLDPVPSAVTDAAEAELEFTVPAKGVATRYELYLTATGMIAEFPLVLGVLETSAAAAEDFPSECKALQTAVVNRALAYIGITQPLVDIETDTSVEAVQGRLHLVKTTDEVLQAFAWPFATAYADLAWVAGTVTEPVNPDWRYSYRVPADCLHVRRIARPGWGRRFDPDPPKYRRAAHDDDGALLWSDFFDPESDDLDEPTLPIEYTARPDCAVETGGALFCEALAWLLAHKLAPSIARNKVTAAECYGKFLSCIARAEGTAANEEEKGVDDVGDASWIQAR